MIMMVAADLNQKHKEILQRFLFFINRSLNISFFLILIVLGVKIWNCLIFKTERVYSLRNLTLIILIHSVYIKREGFFLNILNISFTA